MAERDRGTVNAGGETLTPSVGSSVPPEERWDVALQLKLFSLRSLRDRLSEERSRIKFADRAISFSQLEMLEAELQNQGILPRPGREVSTLRQRTAREAAVWSWRAQRLGFAGSHLSFRLQLPSYLLERAEELLGLVIEEQRKEHAPLLRSSSWRTRGEAVVNARAELTYLDRFAGYLIGEYDSAENAYHRGLNLVLKVVSERTDLEREESLAGPPVMQLPLRRSDFLRLIKKLKEKPEA